MPPARPAIHPVCSLSTECQECDTADKEIIFIADCRGGRLPGGEGKSGQVREGMVWLGLVS